MQKILASVVVFYTPDYKILMHQRKRFDKPDPKWAFLGGKLDAGETPEQGVKREIQEELGYDLSNMDFLKKYNYSGMSKIEFEIYTYLAVFPGFEKIKPTSIEVSKDDLHLLSIEEADKLKKMPVAYEIINDLKAKWTK